jgi:hypothetical protein
VFLILCCCFRFVSQTVYYFIILFKRFFATYRQFFAVTAVNAIDIIAVVDAIDIDGVAGHHAVVGPVIVVVITVEAGGQMCHSHL